MQQLRYWKPVYLRLTQVSDLDGKTNREIVICRLADLEHGRGLLIGINAFAHRNMTDE